MTKLARGRAVYVGYNAVVVDTTAPAVRLKRLIRSQTVRRLIVDVRLNGGGDNTTYLDLLSALQTPKVNRRGRLFLLMGRATFSAAGNFATDVKDYTRAIAVGEPTGGGVKIYSETTSVALPTVGWNVRIATQYMERGAVNDQRLGIDPDVRVDLTSTDFFAGRDPVLARALRGLQ
jgi:C-terminal processing protease CtpA/Prc